MKRFGLATQATLLGVLLASGCASPCGGCGGGMFRGTSMFRGRAPCPCDCCSNSGGYGIYGSYGGGFPIAGGGPVMSDGPLMEPPAPPLATMPPPGATLPGATLPGPMPSLGAPAVPGDPGRLAPIPAQPFSAEPSSRVRKR